MKSLMKLQSIAIFKNPTPYLLVFVLMPILYVLASAFIPAYFVMGAIFVIEIMAMTFFVFGSSMMQTKNSVVFKRLEITGLSKSRFILSNGILSVLLSVGSVYVLIEIFGAIIGLANLEQWFLTINEINIANQTIIVPTQFNWFIANDIVIVLDDATWIMVSDVLEKAAQLLIDNPELFVAIIESISLIIDEMGAIEWSLIMSFLDLLIPSVDHSNISKEDVLLKLDDLINRIEEGNGPVASNIQELSERMNELYISNGEHAPVGIISTMLLDPYLGVGESAESPITWNVDDANAVISTSNRFSFKVYYDPANEESHFNSYVVYAHYAPTLTTIFSPNLGYSSIIQWSSNSAAWTLLQYWIIYFALFLVTSVIMFSIMLMFVSLSNSYEQYAIFSGITSLCVMVFSGIFLPFAVFLSTPFLFTFSSLIPTTGLIFEMNRLWFNYFEANISTQITANYYWTFAYPLFLSIVITIITSRMLTSENGKLTTKFIHDDVSKKSSIINVVVNSILLFLFAYWMFVLANDRKEGVSDYLDPNIYPTNLKMMIPLFAICGYGTLLFVNNVYSSGKSATFYKHKTPLACLNAILLFPIGVITMIITLNSKVIVKSEAPVTQMKT